METNLNPEELTWIIFGIVLFVIMLVSSFIVLFKIYQKQLIKQLIKSNQKEVIYKNKLIEAQIINKDKERKRIASEIHDEIGSQLAILKMIIDALSENNEISIKRFTTLKNSIEKLIISTQNISQGLMPPELEHAGIELAIKGLVENVNIASKDLEIRFNSSPAPESRNLKVELSTYRIVFELIHNTIKHAKATKINISIIYNEGTLSLDYSDNGRGFDLNSTSNKGLGLKNIVSRCLYIDAKYEIKTQVNNGFKFSSKVKLYS
ncbi:MAG: histidine kinase [Vicingaceae bacterium]